MDSWSTSGTNDVGQDVNEFDALEVSPGEDAEHVAGIIANALEKSGWVEIVDVKSAVGQVHLLGRVKPENERNVVHRLMENVLAKSDGKCETFFGKSYFRDSGKMKYGWAFSFASNNLREAAHAVTDAIAEVVPRIEVMEAPLLGPSTPSGSVGGSKGAAVVRG